MLILKVQRVRHSQPHWHPPHNKRFVQHICRPHVLGTTIKQEYCTNSRDVRAKFAKNLRTVVSSVGRVFARICAKFAPSLREVRSPFRPRCNLQGLKRAVCRVTLLACSANRAPRALGLGGREGLEGRVSGGTRASPGKCFSTASWLSKERPARCQQPGHRPNYRAHRRTLGRPCPCPCLAVRNQFWAATAARGSGSQQCHAS